MLICHTASVMKNLRKKAIQLINKIMPQETLQCTELSSLKTLHFMVHLAVARGNHSFQTLLTHVTF